MVKISVSQAACGAAALSCQFVAAACIPQCCEDLSKAPGLAGKVYLPGSVDYVDRMDSYWSVSAALDPWCVVQPSNAEDTSVILKTLGANKCPFGVRGGGHGSFAGSNSVKQGVTIDFGNMNSTTYDPVAKLASIGPGGYWQDVYNTLAPYGVVVTGARAGTVGTGGFITGGGNSFHSASHGYACDTVANFEVVLGDGSIVNANKSHNADLWHAMKGTSGNLGLVTRFDMYAIEFPDPAKPVIWGGNLIYNLSSGPAVIDAMVDFTNNVYKDENSSSIVYWAYLPSLGGMILNAAIENTLATVRPPAFDPYYNVSGITDDTTVVDLMSTITDELGSGEPSGFRNVWFTSAFKNDARVMNYAVEKFYELNAEFETLLTNASDFNTLCMFQPISQSIINSGLQKGGNMFGLERFTKDGNGIMFLVTLAVNGAEHEAAAIPKIQAYTDDIETYAKSVGAYWDWKYTNYAYKDQNPLSTFGADNIAKLKAASAKYDPSGVFEKLRTTGFHIPN